MLAPGDIAPAVQPPDCLPVITINPDDPALQAPSIMGGVDFSGGDLPLRAQSQAVPWTVQSGGANAGLLSFGGDGVPLAPDRARGISTALGAAGTMVDGTHGAIGQIGQIVAKGDSVLKGLKGVTTAITAPLTIGSGVADTVSDINHGASPGAAILGNSLRTAAIFGAGVVGGELGPLGAAGAGYLAGKYLPDGATIGNDVIGLFK